MGPSTEFNHEHAADRASVRNLESRETLNGQPEKMPPFKGAFKIVLFFSFIIALSFGVHAFINHGLRKIPVSKFGAFATFMEGNANAQVVINGSSRALNHYDPRVIQDITGKTAFNIGMNASQIDFQLAILKAYLKHNKKPEIVIQNLDSFSFETTKKGQIYDPGLYVPYLYEDEIYNALLDIDPNVKKWKYIPLYGYAVEDMRFTWVWGILSNLKIYGSQDYFLGFNPRDQTWTGEFERFKAKEGQGHKVEIQPAGLNSLRALAKTCKDQGIQLVLVYSPEYRDAQEFTLNRVEVFATFRKIASEFDVPFLDYSDSPISRQRDLFYNSQHLNREGANAFSINLAKKLRQDAAVGKTSRKIL